VAVSSIQRPPDLAARSHRVVRRLAHDTLAEDNRPLISGPTDGLPLCLSCDEDVPAELPVEINAFKSQQRRWAKGVVQVGIKLFRRMWHDPRLSARVKLEQSSALTGNLAARW